LWVNMVTSVSISLALAFERLEPGTMLRPPRSPKTPLLSSYFIWRILFVSTLIGGGTLYLCLWLLKSGNAYLLEGLALTTIAECGEEHIRQIVRTITLQAIVLGQVFHLFNSRSIRGSAFKEDWFGIGSNKAIWVVTVLAFVLQGAVTYLPFMNTAFGTVPLSINAYLYPFLIGFAVFFIVEGEKAVMRRIDKMRGKVMEY